MKRTMIVALGCAAVLLTPASAIAGQNDSVDPAIMQPGLNPAFAPWDCWRTGTGITCEGHLNDAWTNAEWGLVCDGRPVYTTGTEDRVLVRHGDEDGIGLWSRSHVEIRETLSLQPDGSGPTLNAVGLWAEHFDYPTPGDMATRVERDTGLVMRVNGPGVGLVLHDVGAVTVDIEDNVFSSHGQHPLYEDFEAAFAKVCDAFEAIGA